MVADELDGHPGESEPESAPAVPIRSAGAGHVDHRGFAVLDTGRIVADSDLAVNTAESLLYIARIADAVGYQLGAGGLDAVEVFGRASAYAAIDTQADGSLTLRGGVAPSRSSPEELRVWLESRFPQ
jgi:hypothetical protein